MRVTFGRNQTSKVRSQATLRSLNTSEVAVPAPAPATLQLVLPPAAATASAPSHGCCIRGSPRGCHVSWAGRWVQLSPGLCKHHHHGRLPVSLLPDCASSAPATAAEGHHEGGYKSTFLDGELLRLEPESLGWPCTHGGGASDEVPVSGRYLRTRNPCSRSSASCARRAFD